MPAGNCVSEKVPELSAGRWDLNGLALGVQEESACRWMAVEIEV